VVKTGEDQLPALLVPAERGEVLFIKERYLAGDLGVRVRKDVGSL
jgi:hypothetical protein